MVSAKLTSKEIIDNSDLRENCDPTLSDTQILRFEVSVAIDKDWLDKVYYEDAVSVGESDARVINYFREIFCHLYSLEYDRKRKRK